jgi:uncharacterized membrane protein HdeD (DUF308 family)
MAMFLLGTAAVFWPQQSMVIAILAVGAIAVILSSLETVLALTMRHLSQWWRLIAVHGSMVLAFGVITVGAPGLGLELAMDLLAAWVLCYAVLAFVTAVTVWESPAVRSALFVWSAVNLVVSSLIVLNPGLTLIALLLSGALYAMIFGLWQVMAGLWCRRRVCAVSPLPHHTVHV